MKSNLPAPPTPEEEQALLERMARGDMAARDELITRNLLLVKHVALGFANTGIEYEERFSLGCAGLIKAVDSHDASRGKLSTHICRCAQGEILHEVSHRKRKKRTGTVVSLDAPVAAYRRAGLGDALGAVLPSKGPELIDLIELRDAVRAVHSAIADLPAPWRRYMEARFLSPDGVRRQRETARALGMKQANASRIEIKALAQCRAALGERGFCNG